MAANLGDEATSEASYALDSLPRVKGGVTYIRPPWEVLFESSYSVGHPVSFMATG
jgi:hypothetical protein